MPRPCEQAWVHVSRAHTTKLYPPAGISFPFSRPSGLIFRFAAGNRQQSTPEELAPAGARRSVTADHPASKPIVAPTLASLRDILPGVALAALVAIAAVLAAPIVARVFPIPAMVIALLFGIAFHPTARRPWFQPGLVFCLKM